MEGIALAGILKRQTIGNQIPVTVIVVNQKGLIQDNLHRIAGSVIHFMVPVSLMRKNAFSNKKFPQCLKNTHQLIFFRLHCTFLE